MGLKIILEKYFALLVSLICRRPVFLKKMFKKIRKKYKNRVLWKIEKIIKILEK